MDRADQADVDQDGNTAEVLRFTYHQSALGSVTEVSAPSGAVVEWVAYDVYGLATIRDRVGAVVAQSAVGNPYLITGREFDPEAGHYHYRARIFDPTTGRFLQRDPSGPVDGLNLYEYAMSSPSVGTDPSGRTTEVRPPTNPPPTPREINKRLGEIKQKLDKAAELEKEIQRLRDLYKKLYVPRPGGVNCHEGRSGWTDPFGHILEQIGVLMNVVDALFVEAMLGFMELVADLIGQDKADLLFAEMKKWGAVLDIMERIAGLFKDAGLTENQAAGAVALLGVIPAAKILKVLGIVLKRTGSYTHRFASGKGYHGKGPESRAKVSAREIERKTGDKVVDTEVAPAASDREAFKDESRRMDEDGGPNPEKNYNKIESTGTKMRKEDGEEVNR